MGDLENPGRLPVQHVLGGTGDCVLSSFELSSLFMFLKVEESFTDIPTELPCLRDLENSGYLPVQEDFEVSYPNIRSLTKMF